MYWYIFFLRPPLVSAEAGSHIEFKLQVANDLRTEPKLEPTEIHYFWQLVNGDTTTPSQHLTLFDFYEDTYRSLSVPLPLQARPGEKWRICLFSPTPNRPDQTTSEDIRDFARHSVPCAPIHVYSEGIEIVRPRPTPSTGVVKGVGASSSKSKSKGKGHEQAGGALRDGRPAQTNKGKAKEDTAVPKQKRIERAWSTGGDQLRISEQTSFDLDTKIWDSGLALTSWLYLNLTRDSADTETKHTVRESKDVHSERAIMRDGVLETLGRKNGLFALELGSGTGLVSIALHQIHTRLASLGADTSGRGRTRITATDLGTAHELRERNLKANSISACLHGNGEGDDQEGVELRELDWDKPLPAWLVEAGSTWPDIIIAADVTYNTASFPALVRTLVALLTPSRRAERPRLLLAYKQRDEGERKLWGTLQQEGIGMVLIEKIPGAVPGTGEVEIWVGAEDLLSG